MAAVTYFAVGSTKNAFFLSDATPVARLRTAVFRKDRFKQPSVCHSPNRAILRNLFRRPCALLYERAGLRFGRAPQRAAPPLIPGRARPAPARHHLLRRSRASAFRANLLKDQAAVYPHDKRISIRKNTDGRRADGINGTYSGIFSRMRIKSLPRFSRYSLLIFSNNAITVFGVISRYATNPSGV